MMRSWSSGPSSPAENSGPVISESEFCSEISAFRGERSTLVLYVGAYAGGWMRRSRWQISPGWYNASLVTYSCLRSSARRFAAARRARVRSLPASALRCRSARTMASDRRPADDGRVERLVLDRHLERVQHPGHHRVEAGRQRELDDLARLEVAREVGELLVGHVAVHHRLREAERGALGVGEPRRLAPEEAVLDLLRRHALRA